MNLSVLSSVLKEFECPVCNQYMVGEIALCLQGHSLCVKCKSKLKSGSNSSSSHNTFCASLCPTCRTEIRSGRNYTLEKIATILSFPCRYEGCKEIVSGAELKDHTSFCNFKIFPCILRVTGCAWIGNNFNLKEHVETCHAEIIGKPIYLSSNLLQSTNPTPERATGIFDPVNSFVFNTNPTVESPTGTFGFNSNKDVITKDLQCKVVVKGEIFIVFTSRDSNKLTISCMCSSYTQKSNYKLLVSFKDITRPGVEMTTTVPCIPRCDIADVFKSHRAIFLKEMLNQFFYHSGDYILSTTLVE